ncbi:hypothetical protein [Gilliamella sp. ESL0254]|uniref:hypothetical protein n=1 Tax=Gilliamella sp. ESL0254 TaxID=2705035 RepID=UPI001580B224|nr:hypothetical protein [Gilliamella sp. ESL0254]NUF26821.1 hypothetical protein [Gilliamella sp. ESL0254]
MLLLLYSQSSQALSAQTTKVIEGNAPYLTFDGGRTRANSVDSLLAITLPDGRTITPSTNTSDATNPIKLINGRTLGDISMSVPSSTNLLNLNDLVNRYHYWGDDDGDGQGANGITATGSISVSFTDKNGHTVSRSDTLDICDAPYKVTLSSTGGSLATQYGMPNSSIFSGSTVSYYINPNELPKICYVRVNLIYGGGNLDFRDNPSLAGPASIWDQNRGFLVQSTSLSSYDLNFPTTGLDGLYFDLDIGGVDGSELMWSVVTNGSIRATVSWTRPHSGSFIDPERNSRPADIWISDKSHYVTRVMLNGPRADSNQISSANPSPLTVPSLPQTFELVGRDSRGNEVRYGFVLRQWFVNRGGKHDTQSNQISWCSRLGYRLAKVKDLTNAKCGVHHYFPCSGGIDGATPRSSDNNYMRHIGAGFFTEWGYMNYYADVGFVYNYYWASDVAGSTPFAVSSGGGVVYSYLASSDLYAVCTSP